LSDTSDRFPAVYNAFMNKRAKKRLKETIEKEKAERAKAHPDQNLSSPKDPQKLRGFLPKPEKKRG
jgi:hypothetical protein